MPTYTYLCESCNETTDGLFKLSETRPETVECILCGGVARYQLSAPMVLKASFLDGQRSKQWKDLKEASKLNKLAAGEDNLEKKKEIQKEASKIGFNFSKDPT